MDRDKLDVQQARVQAALSNTTKPRQRLRTAQATLQSAERSLGDEIRQFNQYRLELIADEITAEGLGWCMSGRHLATEDDLLGMVETGKHWTGDHYYEREESYTKVFTICRRHAEALGQHHQSGTSRRNLVSLDIRATWAEAIATSWPRELNEFLATHDIPEPISLAR